MQISENLISNAMASKTGNAQLEEMKNRQNADIADFKTSLVNKLSEQEKSLPFEKKPMEKIAPKKSVKPKDGNTSIDDTALSQAVATVVKAESGVSKSETSDVEPNENTPVAAMTVRATDNLMKSMLVSEEQPVDALLELKEESVQNIAHTDLWGNASDADELSLITNADMQIAKENITFNSKPEIVNNAINVRSNELYAENEELETAPLYSKPIIKEVSEIDENVFEATDVKPTKSLDEQIDPLNADDESIGFALPRANNEQDVNGKKDVSIEEKAKLIGDLRATADILANVDETSHAVNAVDTKLYSDDEMRQILIDQIASYIDRNKIAQDNTMTLMLEPNNLGKLLMTVKHQAAYVAISIQCETQKTYHLLQHESANIAGILSKKLEEPVLVNIQQEDRADYLQQNNKNDEGNGYYDEQQQNKQSKDETQSFLSRLRLGIG